MSEGFGQASSQRRAGRGPRCLLLAPQPALVRAALRLSLRAAFQGWREGSPQGPWAEPRPETMPSGPSFQDPWDPQEGPGGNSLLVEWVHEWMGEQGHVGCWPRDNTWQLGHERMKAGMAGRMGGWTDGRMDRRTNRILKSWGLV